MGHNSGKKQLISAAILVGLLMSLLGMPLNGNSKIPASVKPLGGDPKSPSVAAIDLDSDYFQKYIDSVLFPIYNLSRDTNTEFDLENTYYHLLTNNWSSVIGAEDKYSLDNILVYLGLWAMKFAEASAGAVVLFNTSVASSPLYKQFNGSTGAFRLKMGENGTSLDDTFRMVDNTLGLFTLLRFVGTSSVEPAPGLSSKLYSYLMNTLWHPDSDYEHNYFREQNGTDLGETLSFSNLLGAFISSVVARNEGLGTTIRNQASAIALQAFQAVNRSGVYEDFGGGINYSYVESEATYHGESLLKTNAMGIAALADFYIRLGRVEANRSLLTQAEDLYRVINTHFYNSTLGPLGGYMDDVIWPSGSGLSINCTLESNAYWLLALARLFEASGNITYYEKGIEVYNQVVANLWDQHWAGFNRSMGYFGNDPTKSVGDNALFYTMLAELDRSYWDTTFEIITPPTPCVIQTNPILNFTCQYNVSWVRDFTDAIPGLTYNINQTIAGANVSFSLRYGSNGTFITQLQNNTNVNGTCNLIYALPADLPLGTYAIFGYANRTGFGTAYVYQQFSIISNISVSQVDPAIKVVQGETSAFNITFSSTRNNASLVFFNGTGAGFNMNGFSFLLANNTTTEQIMNVTADFDALIGFHNTTFTLINDSTTLFDFNVSIEVLPAVSLELVEYAKVIVPGIDGEIDLVLENARPNALETINVSLSGVDIQAFYQSFSLQGGERLRIYVPFRFTGSYNVGSLTFEVTVSRYSQIVDTKSYTSELAPPIEVVDMSTSAAVVQGREYYINFHAINNVNVTQLVDLYINGKLEVEDIVLLPGENEKIVPRAPLTINPWDFSTYILDVTLKVGNEDIFQDRLSIQAVPSVENVLFFYVIPIVLPIAIVLIFIQRQKKRELLR